MKKTVSILLVAALMAAFLALTVFATEALQFAVDSTSATCGEEIILKVSLGNNPGFTNGCVVVNYDEANLELVDILVGNEDEYDKGYEANTTWKGLINHNENKVNFATTADTKRAHLMFEVVLKVKDNAAKGDYTIGIEVEYVKNNAGEDVLTEVKSGVVHICSMTDVAETAATCTANGYKAHRKCACGKVFVDGAEVTAESVTIPAYGHSYGAPSFAWGDTYTCKATSVCASCGESITMDCQVTSQTTEATCVAEGKVVHTATATVDGKTYTDTREEVLAIVDTHTDADGNILCDLCGKVLGEVKVEVKEEFTDDDVPEELQGAGLDTIVKIEEEMQTQIQEELNALLEEAEDFQEVVIEPEDTYLYEVVLMYEDQNGQMQEADQDHFPEDGKLMVTLPVPAGTSPETHKYHVAHMFTTSAFGKNPGDVEIFTDLVAEPDGNGGWCITFEVTGLSPIMICTEERGMLGDVNGDGKINTTDAKLIMQYELKLIEAGKLDVAFADVNGDGKINSTDAKLIMQFELGSITQFPVEKKE